MACSWTSSRLLRACVGVCSGASVCGRLSVRDRVVENGREGGLAGPGDGGEDAELLPCFLRDLLGEARIDAVHILEAYGVPTSQDGVAGTYVGFWAEIWGSVLSRNLTRLLGRLHLFRAVTRV